LLTPSDAYTKLRLHQAMLAPSCACTKLRLHQAMLTPSCAYTKRCLHQAEIYNPKKEGKFDDLRRFTLEIFLKKS
jgi:hypothetical protein